MIAYEIAPKGSTGTGRFAINHVGGWRTVAIEFEVEAVGGTPAISWQIQGQVDRNAGRTDEDPAAPLWENLAYDRSDATVAASTAAQTGVSVGKVIVWVEGMDKRAFRQIAVNVTANTNVTFSVRAHVSEGS